MAERSPVDAKLSCAYYFGLGIATSAFSTLTISSPVVALSVALPWNRTACEVIRLQVDKAAGLLRTLLEYAFYRAVRPPGPRFTSGTPRQGQYRYSIETSINPILYSIIRDQPFIGMKTKESSEGRKAEFVYC